MEGDRDAPDAIPKPSVFQSTPSAWRETRPVAVLSNGKIYFNPLPPHGGRHPERCTPPYWQGISIHSLRMEGDENIPECVQGDNGFQSTPSAWRETTLSAADMADWTFQSTPSAWRETLEGHCSEQSISHFNPLPPHGGRHDVPEEKKEEKVFQSTPSAWRETTAARLESVNVGFQSTPSAWRETIPSTSLYICRH